MIQRIQSVYLAVTILFVSIATFGATIFYFQAPEQNYALNAFGVLKLDPDGTKEYLSSIPFYYVGFVLILLCLFTLVLFKNLKRQLALARFTALIYFIILVFTGFGAFLGTYFTEEETIKFAPTIGFYLLVLGFVLLLLAVWSINKDKKLIDSVNRLR